MSQPLERQIYSGLFTVELYEGATQEFVQRAASACIQGDIVTVPCGTAEAVMGGLQFRAEGVPFGWGWDQVKQVLGRNGEILWRNRNFNPEKK